MRWTLVAALLALAARACPDDEKCLMCLLRPQGNECAVCQESLLNPASGLCDTVPDPPIANCLEYKDRAICRQCRFGFRVDEKAHSSACVPCQVDECARCDRDARVCTHCFHNLRLRLNADGAQVCGPETAAVPNCLINKSGLSEGDCEVCAEGFVVDPQAKCVKSGLAYCWRAKKPDWCDVCHYGHYMSANGKCAKRRTPWLIVAVVLAAITAGVALLVCARKTRTFDKTDALLD